MSAELFRPSSDSFGETVGDLVRCRDCGHGFVSDLPPPDSVTQAYELAADPVSVREEPGQVQTAKSALGQIESQVPPGSLLDVGCWTGSVLVAAAERGWVPTGVEPSAWAAARARERGVRVLSGELDGLATGVDSYRAITLFDVLEHLADPATALQRLHGLLEPGGVLFLTVPDAGSAVARAMGRRWWSILPMHLQYFTRGSLRRALESHGFEVVKMSSHPKVFSLRYYTERFATFVPVVGPFVARTMNRTRWADRLVAPDFHDRIAAVARRPVTSPAIEPVARSD